LNKQSYIIILFTSIIGLFSCEEPKDQTPVDTQEELTGGLATSFDFGENAFGHAVSGLSYEDEDKFVIGNSFFRSNWTVAPASASARDGLGPLFNGLSCGSCHNLDGRAEPPKSPSESLNGLLFRISTSGFSVNGGPKPDRIYGDQLQDKAIPTVKPEVKVSVRYEEVIGRYTDGTAYNLRKPIYVFSGWGYGEPEANFMFSPRIGMQVFGLGLLENISETDILLNTDENDENRDGISGKANYVWDAINKRKSLGKFGWKANQPSLKQQTTAAFNGDIGITTSVFPVHELSESQGFLNEIPNGGEPEISDKNIDNVVFYLQTLAVPARRNHTDDNVLRGKALFTKLNCSGCHRPSFTTATNSIKQLNSQNIFPYTDLLLHDMGDALADGRPDFLATGNEWRTSPLWGIGLIKTVNKHTTLLHDGRARNIEEAILWHGGESQNSTESFKKLSSTDRNQLIKFVESL
jgi:CxxC motif-containing protein (DUF1111 family)